ncbi:hypothetical protein L873DRAFT_1788087 [Choiromyces venosus 120613-1]|uniref:Uncharacterized protein n=1 Tax=Choiromyces venosus 120613-1 TaxID=1336337 RepID=A0A3N4JTR9_9PEZI|nr:hypothetical protein L873DRAFT_1788087 [Choiromyces venosus 120613-1]
MKNQYCMVRVHERQGDLWASTTTVFKFTIHAEPSGLLRLQAALTGTASSIRSVDYSTNSTADFQPSSSAPFLTLDRFSQLRKESLHLPNPLKIRFKNLVLLVLLTTFHPPSQHITPITTKHDTLQARIDYHPLTPISTSLSVQVSNPLQTAGYTYLHK